MNFTVDKSTIPFEKFLALKAWWSEQFKQKIIDTFSPKQKGWVQRVIEWNGLEEKSYSWYALSVGAEDITHKHFYGTFVPGVTFRKTAWVDGWFIEQHHTFYKRWEETVQQTIERVEQFIAEWWLHYVVHETNGAIIGTLNAKKKWSFAAVFSYMVDQKRRKQWVGKLLVANAHEDLVDQWVRSIWAKTKNTYVYLLITRWYKGDILWKEVYA